jgi:hypothetical protein
VLDNGLAQIEAELSRSDLTLRLGVLVDRTLGSLGASETNENPSCGDENARSIDEFTSRQVRSCVVIERSRNDPNDADGHEQHATGIENRPPVIVDRAVNDARA